MEILQMCGLPGLRDISRYERKLEFQTEREARRTLLFKRVAAGENAIDAGHLAGTDGKARPQGRL